MTLKSSIQMYDGLSQPMIGMVRSINLVINTMQSMQTVSERPINAAALNEAAASIRQIEAGFHRVEESIRGAQEQQEKFNGSAGRGAGAVGGLKRMLVGMGGAIGVQKVVELSDEYARTTARLRLMAGENANIARLQDQIYQSAQRTRASYFGTADAVAKLSLRAGSVFKNTQETIGFVELLNKQYKIAGASQMEAASATLQLTQALGSGVLRGEEFNAVFEAAPNVMQTVADYMDVPIGKLREMASDGEITAEIVKNAMFAASSSINQSFETIPMTWADVWTKTVNTVIQISQPLLGFINFLANNIAIFGPIILGVAASILAYQVAVNAATIATAALTVGKIIALPIYSLLTGATMANTAAQWGLNAALYACPIIWIILIIIALIAIFYAVIGAVNKFANKSISATGLIVGAFMVFAAAVGNIAIGLFNSLIQLLWTIFVEPFIGIIEWVLNVANGGFDSFGDAVANLIGQMISWFLSLGKVVTKIIDAIFGTNWTAGLSSLQDKVLAWGKNDSAITLSRDAPGINHRFEYGKAWDAGYSFGQGVDDKLSGAAGSPLLNPETAPFDDSMIGSNLDDISGDTGRIADSVEVSEEDLKYLRDIAERDAVNRFTTAEIKMEMTNNNNITNPRDADGLIAQLKEGLFEAMNTAAEGV